MAARKDDLGSHHRAQVERLLAEGEIIAATAQANRWRAAEAAAVARKASDEAAAAAGEAKKSAAAAKGYAADAKRSADAADVSAGRARDSAVTARKAATAADRDADDAEASAAQAEFSATYARESARRADDAATQARASAIAAGKSKDEADKAASQAWSEVKRKREAEIAEAKRLAEALRKEQAEAAKKKKTPCIIPYNRDTVPPCVTQHDKYEVIFSRPDPELVKLIGKVAWEVSGAADIERCIKEPSWGGCAMAAAGVIPVGKVKLLGKAAEGVEDVAKGTRFGRAVPPCLRKPGKHSFPAGTRVLTGDGATRPIEDIRTGDTVLATDPGSGVTGARRVDATIYTPDDREFTDITLDRNSGGGSLTTTDSHPFWTENGKKWKDAAELTPADVLRTPDGGTAQIAGIRHWTGLAPAYNLTVAGLHTYYVLVGTAPVLVHNEEMCGINNFADNAYLYHVIETEQGPMEMMAGVSISGLEVTLSDIAVYGQGKMSRGSLGREGTALMLKEIRRNLLPSLRKQGYGGGTLRIAGVRVSGPVGHRPDLKFKIPEE
ncbi:polymorphic toxin-type HINT domain-containing protein [Streptomyces chrestomyceticus]